MKDSIYHYTLHCLYTLSKKVNIPCKVQSLLLKSIHINLPIYFIFMVSVLPKNICKIVIVVWTILFLIYFHNKRCILSDLEQKIEPDNIYVQDFLLYMLNMDRNIQNYNTLTCTIYITVLLLIGMIFMYRFDTHFKH